MLSKPAPVATLTQRPCQEGTRMMTLWSPDRSFYYTGPGYYLQDIAFENRWECRLG